MQGPGWVESPNTTSDKRTKCTVETRPTRSGREDPPLPSLGAYGYFTDPKFRSGLPDRFPPFPLRVRTVTPVPLVEANRFLLDVASTLHEFGTSAHRLEATLDRVAERLGVRGQFLVTPTFVIVQVGDGGGASHIHLERMYGGEVDFDRMIDLHRLIEAFVAGHTTFIEAREQLDDVGEAPPPRRFIPFVLVSVLAAASAAVILDGGVPETLAATVLGGGMGALVHASRGRARLSSVLPLIAGFVAAASAGVASGLWGPLSIYVVALAGILTLLPGLTLTIAMSELAYGHLVSGGSRLVGVMITLLQIAFGVALGQEVAVGLFPGLSEADPLAMGGLALVGAGLVNVLAFGYRSGARLIDLPVLAVAAGVGLASSRLGVYFAGPELGILISAWVVGTMGRILSRWRRVPSTVAVLPGLLLLLPGSLGFRGVSSLLAQDVLIGLESAMNAVVIAFSLVMGLFLSNLTSQPREGL